MGINSATLGLLPEAGRSRRTLLGASGGSTAVSYLDLRGPTPPGSQRSYPTWISGVLPCRDLRVLVSRAGGG